ncbi:MAG: cytochrome c oxidase assembly protein, partial [Pseudomonadota bacterium]|nr:cytochrome c oxidase assembly protein [Pseudomonadota bacterium]
MHSNNRFLVLNLLAIVAGMLMLTAASVPLYKLFCQATGYGGATGRALHAPLEAGSRTFTVTFNADVHPGLPWKFYPERRSVKVTVGKQALAYFRAENLSNHPITGRAIYNVIPLEAGSYFFKIQCFCFSNQTLLPGQKVDMPVLFYIAPGVSKDTNMD